MYHNSFRNIFHAEDISDISFALLDKLSIIDNHDYIVANTMTGKILHCTSSTYIFSRFSHEELLERGIDYFIGLMHEEDTNEISYIIRAISELAHSIGNDAKNLIYHSTIKIRFGKQYRPFLIKAFALTDELSLIATKPAPLNPTYHQLCWNPKAKMLYRYSAQTHKFIKTARTPLNDKQMEILLLLGTGMNKDEVANTMCITTNTLNYHIKEIKTKLGTSSIAESMSQIVSYNFLM